MRNLHLFFFHFLIFNSYLAFYLYTYLNYNICNFFNTLDTQKYFKTASLSRCVTIRFTTVILLGNHPFTMIILLPRHSSKKLSPFSFPHHIYLLFLCRLVWILLYHSNLPAPLLKQFFSSFDCIS
jgi:hypothetical protein